MRHFVIAVVVAWATFCALVVRSSGQVHFSAAVPTCDTLYVGPPDGAWQLVTNWTNGIPAPDDMACFPPEASELARRWPGVARIVDPRSTAGSDEPAHVTGGHGPPYV